MVALGKRAPVKNRGRQGFIALGPGPGEKVRRLQFSFVDAVTGDPMEIEIDVNRVLAA